NRLIGRDPPGRPARGDAEIGGAVDEGGESAVASHGGAGPRPADHRGELRRPTTVRAPGGPPRSERPVPGRHVRAATGYAPMDTPPRAGRTPTMTSQSPSPAFSGGFRPD